MAKPNFLFQKRQKELERKKKNEEKQQRKLERRTVGDEESPEARSGVHRAAALFVSSADAPLCAKTRRGLPNPCLR